MKQLSGLDASFLYLETAEMPMHVGALHLFELPAGYRGDYLEDMRAHMASRLPLAPALRRKLAWMPLNLAAPVWVDAEPDLEKHIVGITLPEDSGLAELEEQVGELHPVLLDRSRPLWKFHVFDGLEPGPNGEKRYAMYTQLHHAAVDGQAAVALAQAILDLGPEPREIPARPARERKGQLAMTEMLRGALSNQLGQLGNLVKALPSAVGAISQVAAQTAGGAVGDTVASVWSRIKGAGPKGSKSVSNLGLAPRTRLNATVSDTRAFAAVSLPLAELNAVRRRAPCQPERRGADGLQRRAAPPLRQARAAAAQVAGRGGADLAARQGRHGVEQPGLDEPDQPGHAHRRPGASGWRT